MHIHVINLDRSPERLAEFCKVNGHLSELFRVSAIDGSKLDIDALAQHGLVSADILNMFTIGAVGCAMSHLHIWDAAIAHDQMFTIAEDDAIFNHGFEEQAAAALARIPANWDVIYWGFNFDLFVGFELVPNVSPCVATFSWEQLRNGLDAFQRETIYPQTFKALWVFGTCCYSISPKGAKTIRDKILPFRPQIISFPEAAGVHPFSATWRNVGLDNSFNAIQREIRSYVCFPPLVVATNEPHRSTIAR